MATIGIRTEPCINPDIDEEDFSGDEITQVLDARDETGTKGPDTLELANPERERVIQLMIKVFFEDHKTEIAHFRTMVMLYGIQVMYKFINEYLKDVEEYRSLLEDGSIQEEIKRVKIKDVPEEEFITALLKFKDLFFSTP